MPDLSRQNGLTLTSLAASAFAMLLMGMLIQYSEVVLCISFPAEHTLALPAIWVFILLTLLLAAVYALTRVKLLTAPRCSA